MKYFKYKAKYIQELERQKGAGMLQKIKDQASSLGSKISSGASSLGSKISSGASSLGSKISSIGSADTDKIKMLKDDLAAYGIEAKNFKLLEISFVDLISLEKYIKDTIPLTSDQRKDLLKLYSSLCKKGIFKPTISPNCTKMDNNNSLNATIVQFINNNKNLKFEYNIKTTDNKFDSILEKIKKLPLTETQLQKLLTLSKECQMYLSQNIYAACVSE